MKKKNWLAFALMALLAPALAGCKFKCDDAKPIKRDVLRVKAILETAIQDPRTWEHACNELAPRAMRLVRHSRELTQVTDSRQCRRDRNREDCEQLEILSTGLLSLKDRVFSICSEAREHALNEVNFANSSEGRALTDRARSTLRMIDGSIVVPGTAMMSLACGNNSDDELFSDLSSPNNYETSSVHNGNGRTEEELATERGELPEDRVNEGGSAGSANAE